MSRIALITFLALTLFAPYSYSSSGEDDWMPEARHVEAASQGRDCAIFRSLSTKSRLVLDQAKDAELHLSELLKVRRADLVQCAELRHVELDGSNESEELAAEVCPERYEEWLKTGYRLRASRDDLKGTQKSIDLLNANLERYCARPGESNPGLLRVR